MFELLSDFRYDLILIAATILPWVEMGILLMRTSPALRKKVYKRSLLVAITLSLASLLLGTWFATKLIGFDQPQLRAVLECAISLLIWLHAGILFQCLFYWKLKGWYDHRFSIADD